MTIFYLPIRNRAEFDASKVLGATFESDQGDGWAPIASYLRGLAGAIERGQTTTRMRAVFESKP